MVTNKTMFSLTTTSTAVFVFLDEVDNIVHNMVSVMPSISSQAVGVALRAGFTCTGFCQVLQCLAVV